MEHALATLVDWERLRDAYDLVKMGKARKIEDDRWVVYRCGAIIRVDIKED